HFEDLARAHDLPHVRACDINSEEVRQSLTAHAIDLMVVAGWSQQVHEQALADLSLGGVGLHPTPLPVGRGHAPIPWTILRGMSASAVTLHHLAAEAGAGDVVDQIWFDLPDDVTATACTNASPTCRANCSYGTSTTFWPAPHLAAPRADTPRCGPSDGPATGAWT